MKRTAVLLTVLLTAAHSRAGSETPPAGPPWVRDLAEAQVEGITAGKPIFLYMTKTH